MNSDIRISVSFRGHRKRKRLKLLLGPGSTDYLLDLWIATAMNHPSGVLIGMDALDIALEAGWEGDPIVFVEALMTCCLMEKREDGTYLMHDWEEHQGYVVHAQQRTERAKNAALKRWASNHDGNGNANSMPDACLAYAPSPAPAPAPAPSPAPAPAPAPSPAPAPAPAPIAEKHSPPSPSQGEEPGASLQPPKDRLPNCPYSKIVNCYHSRLPELPPCSELTETLKKTLACRWKEHPDLDWWDEYWTLISGSDFLMGRKPDCDFKASFPWLIGPKNMAKVLGGQYHRGRDSPFSGILSTDGQATLRNGLSLIAKLKAQQEAQVERP